MTRVWYCRNCGYEVTSRGRCHSCRQKLTASALRQLPPGREDDEVGYRLEDWGERQRGRLIERLNDLAIEHRFEDEELVVDASDEARVDDLVALLADRTGSGDDDGDDDGGDGTPDAVEEAGADPSSGFEEGEPPAAVSAAIRQLYDAAARLRADPTDMQADADVAEASTAVFVSDHFGPADADTWAAVGRVTRRLLSLLGADEALEEGIRSDAAILHKLLEPVVGGPAPTAAQISAPLTPDQAAPASAGTATAGPPPTDAAEVSAPLAPAAARTVYELPEWLPEQRAELGVLLDGASIGYEWDGDELLVPEDRETEVEALFSKVGGDAPTDDDDGGEARYRAVAELFAAAGRLAGDPGDEQKAEAVVQWVHAAEGPPLIGMDDVDWFRIMKRARELLGAIDSADTADVAGHAATLTDLLRAVV